VGRAVAHAPVHPTLVLGALPIQQFGSAEQKRRYLPRVASGAALLSAALVESPAGGGDPAAPSTRARRDGEGWRLDGRKLFVPIAHVAERVLVPARTGPGGVGVFLVDPRGDGVSIQRQETTNFEIECVLDLDGARVGAADVLGDPEGGARIVAWLLDRALASLCALQLGNCEKALRATATYTSERRQFDRPVGSFQAVHQRAADAYIDVEAMRLSYWQAVHRLEAGEPAAEALALAKFWAAEGGARVSYAAQHLHGGIGVDIDYPVHRYYLWARQIGIHLGTGTAQLAKLGARLAAG
jgi:alkylation response protein AidB-like acyl-CoA dehydrogenase